MPVAFEDYYQVLGIPKTASQDEVKKAFRSLARKHHPDVAQDKKTAEEQFKRINEAYTVLGNPENRAKYDRLGSAWDQPERPGPSGRGQGASSYGSWGDPSEGGMPHFEGTGFSDFFEQYFGAGHRHARWQDMAGEASQQHSTRRTGQDVEGDLAVPLEEVLTGTVRTVTMRRRDPNGEKAEEHTFRVRLPKGVKEGQWIRVAGKGYPGMDGGKPGDLFLRVQYVVHPEFRVQGHDLRHELNLPPWELILGTTARVRTLDGEVQLKIPMGSRAGQVLRVRNRGLPKPDGTSRGDFLVSVNVIIPEIVTPEQRNAWEALAKSYEPMDKS
jgi:curved DNA-binding protein